MKKGAIGLSMNMLVVIIIGLVMLGGGITLLYKFVGGAEDTKALLDSRTNAELDRLLTDQGQTVALPRNAATIARAQHHVFGLGILNIADEADFRIDVVAKGGVDDTGNELAGDNSWVLYDNEPVTLEQGESYKQNILVQIPAEAQSGKYIFDVSVFTDKQYGRTQKLYVTVE